MTRQQAETLVSAQEGRTCVRFFRRSDGTLLTSDCPVGVSAWRRRLVMGLSAAGVVRLAAELNQPPFALIETVHDGPLPQRRSFAADGAGDAVVTVLKRAEDDDALVVRAFESAGRGGRARIELPLLDRVVDTDFGPHEIKTFRVPRDPGDPIAEVNLLEW